MPPVDLPRGNAGPKPVAKPAPKPAPKPASSATAYQTFHTSEAASAKPSVQKTNAALAQKAIAAQPLQTFHTEEANSAKPSVQKANAALAAKLLASTKAKNTAVSAGRLASILPPIAAVQASQIHGATGIAGKLFDQIYHMPGDTLKSIMTLGVPAVQGFGALVGGGNAHEALQKFGQVGSEVGQGLAHDPVVQAIKHGDPSYLAKDPLGTLMDASLLYDAVGKTAGLTTGAARTARAAHELVPGIEGTKVLRQPSNNAFTRAFQKYADARGGAARVLPPGMQGSAVGHQLRKMVAQWYGPEKSQIAGELHATDKALKTELPKGKEEANVTPYMAAFGATPDTLYRARQFLHDAQQSGHLSPVTGPVHIQNIENAIAKHEAGKFDWQAAQRAAEGYGTRQTALEGLKSQLNLLEDPEAERAALKQYALQQMPGTRVLPRPISHPEDVLARRAAQSQLRQAEREFKNAQLSHAKNMAGQTPLEKQLAGLRKQYAAASARSGMDAMRGNFATDAALRRYITSDVLDEKIHDLVPQAKAERAALREEGKNRIEATRANLKDARAEFSMAKNTPLRKYRGLVVEDPNATPIQAGTFKGQRFRPMTDAEIRKEMEQRGLSNSYVRMDNPARQRAVTWNDLRAQRPPGSTMTGKAYTGRAPQTGDWAAGYNAMARSQLQDVMNIGAARMERRFLDRFGLKHPDGSHFTEEEAKTAADQYREQHGIPMEVVQDVSAGKGQYTVVPQAAWEELGRQIKLERPGGLAKVGLRFNRAFRNTTLPMSTKLWVMHPVENVTRAGMIGASPMSWRLERAVMSDMRTAGLSEEADRLVDIATPGGLGGQQHRLNLEDMSRATPMDRAAWRQQAGRAAQAWDDTARTIIRGQRAIEIWTQQAALGVHMQRTLRSWGVSNMEMNLHMDRYVHQLAEAYADPAMAEDAAHFLHNAMGQYNNFTSGMRWFITRVSPFLPWYLNAAKLVMIGLPRDHPMISVLLHDVRQATAAQWDAQHAGLPADMQTDVNTGQGRWTDFARLLPVGLTGSPISEAEQLIVPQYSGALHAAYGQDPFGGEFKGPTTPFGKSAYKFGDPGTLPHIAEQLGEVSLGPIPLFMKSIENTKGQTEYNTSLPLAGQVQYKPNTEDSHLRGLPAGFARNFNPFRSTRFGGGGGSGSLAGAGGLDLSNTSGGSLAGAGGLNLSGAK